MANEIANKKESNVVAFDESILLEDVGSGSEGMTKDDILMPRLAILQQMSDQINKRHGDYVDGAEAGHIFDNVAKTAHDGEKGITIVPVTYRRAHIEWKPDRGGLVADHGSDSSCLESCTRGEKGEYITSEGNQIPAMFWTAYQLTTVPESNDLGSWFGWGIKMKYDAASGGIIQNIPNGKNIYLEARKFKKDVKEGNVKVSPESQDDDVM